VRCHSNPAALMYASCDNVIAQSLTDRAAQSWDIRKFSVTVTQLHACNSKA